jgi:hypothetical protein
VKLGFKLSGKEDQQAALKLFTITIAPVAVVTASSTRDAEPPPHQLAAGSNHDRALRALAGQ